LQQVLKWICRVHDQKLCILALSSILSTPTEQIPTLSGNLGSILDGIIKVFETYPDAVAGKYKDCTG
jgi:hypothetical protein